MIKLYGTILCPDCRVAMINLDKAGVAYEFFDISTNLLNLKRFLNIRDTSHVFNKVKENLGIGIPCIVLEDGTITLNLEDALNK
ncbi:glutaredoxin [Clostridium sp. P21]|uniref:Glutaredoxin n=1 Tax=Clostridium muellerianum TaxID=2716538 RepID=A0A7Y0EH37_9CLOT|nr:glutaredoxin [Clostridium muellerianum]NMM63369.1 glutaredoxin [Clostridium muellerianum]